jgi:hypothetical protein
MRTFGTGLDSKLGWAVVIVAALVYVVFRLLPWFS